MKRHVSRRMAVFVLALAMLFSSVLVSVNADSKTNRPVQSEAAASRTKNVEIIRIEGSKHVAKGKEIILKASVSPDSADPKITWTTSDKKVATVSGKGVVKGIKTGDVTITATSESNPNVKETWELQVMAKAGTKIEITGEKKINLAGEKKKTVQLKATVLPDKAAQTVEWKSSDTSVATVSKTGKVTARKTGTVKITASTVDGSKKEAVFTIKVVNVRGKTKGNDKEASSYKIDSDGTLTYAEIVDGNVTIPAQVDNIKVTALQKELFKDNTALKSLTIKAELKEIPEGLCDGCTALTSAVLPNSVEKISKRAFAGASSLSHISSIEPDEVIIIEPEITTAPPTEEPATPTPTTPAPPTEEPATPTPTTPAPSTEDPATPTPTAEPTATSSPSTMPDIGTVFKLSGLKYKITGKNTVSFIGLVKSGSKTKITIPAKVVYKTNTYKVTAIGDKALQKDSKITTLTIGKNVQIIGKYAFASCTRLKTVKGGTGVTDIRDSAFSGCKAMTSFPVLNKLKTIGANAFKGVKSLTSFTLASTVKSIGKNAFYGCSKLKTITVKTEKLTTKNVGSGAFKGILKNAAFKCPKKKLKDYKKLFIQKGAAKTCKFKQ